MLDWQRVVLVGREHAGGGGEGGLVGGFSYVASAGLFRVESGWGACWKSGEEGRKEMGVRAKSYKYCSYGKTYTTH